MLLWYSLFRTHRKNAGWVGRCSGVRKRGDSVSKLQLDQVEILVVDPAAGSRDSVRDILHDQGFRNMALGESRADIEARIAYKMPDLLISEVDLPDGDFAELVIGIRHNRIGANPFVPVIALTWAPQPELVQRIVDSGADLLLNQPLSASIIAQRIHALIHARKPFAVTSDYIGPDRRGDAGRESAISLIDVPNTLEVKATGKQNQAPLGAAIVESARAVNVHRLQRNAGLIAAIIEEIAAGLENGLADGGTLSQIARVHNTLEDTSRRMVGTPFDHVSELCESLAKVLRGTAEATEADTTYTREVRLLRPLAQAIRAGFEVDAATAAREISESLAAKR